jgi:transcription-repair coupling factor (superfamily II helicase)
MRLQRLYPKTVVKAAVNTILVPRPSTARVGGTPLTGLELLDWARQVVDVVSSDVKQTEQGASA